MLDPGCSMLDPRSSSIEQYFSVVMFFISNKEIVMKNQFRFSFLLFILMTIIHPVQAQEQMEDIVLGKRINFQSEVLGEERQIMVYLPTGYHQTKTKFPVLYLLDGRTHFQHASSTVQFLSRNGRIPQLIVVAIVNVDRTRDFTPTTTERRPQSGGAKKFIEFLQKELFPMIENNYRTVPYRLLEGHSLGGTFCFHALFKYPQLFQAYFAMSPYVMWDENYILNESMNKLQESITFKNFIYITLGNEPNYVEPLGRFTKELEAKKPEGLEWHYEVMDNDNHGTVPLKSLYNGLEILYKDWQVKTAVADQGIASVQNHYNKLSEKYGYKVEIPENVLNTMGYRAIGQKKLELAIEFFLHNVKLYPESANVYDSLGEGYEAAGELELAKENYKKAIKIGTELNDRNLAIYKEHLNNVSKKISEAKS
jgi:predicted alpha/beta superfamily hydrolase